MLSKTGLRRLGPQGLLNRLLTSDSSPTADLYFANACRDMLESGAVKQYAPTVFASDSTQLVMRHDARAPAGLTRDRLVYFIDDIWDYGGEDPGLSWFYRNKMALVEGRSAAWYMKRADAVVVSTPMLAKAARRDAPQADVYQIDPYWSEPLATLDHFDSPGFDIAYLGGQVHRADLDFLFPVIRQVLKDTPAATFTLSVGHKLPRDLDTHPRVQRLQALRWRDYRRLLPTKRFHVALYPLLDTPFNRGRSVNKVIEHAIAGAVGVYSDWWVDGMCGGGEVSVPNKVGHWVEAVEMLGAADDALGNRARTAKTAVNNIVLKSTQAELWQILMSGR